jgi:RNA polymerase sigma factor (sigma-70 family)
MKSFTGAEAVFEDGRPNNILDRAALEEHFDGLLAANGPALARLAASYTNTRTDRDDLLQEISMAIWQALPRFRGECSERTFLFRIAHNRSVAYLARVRSRWNEFSEETEIRDPAPDPEFEVAQEQTAERLRRAIYRLPLAYRQVVTLALEDLGYSEIAGVLGISENNVGVRLNRARQILRELLENRK